jgi:hypothetical protein
MASESLGAIIVGTTTLWSLKLHNINKKILSDNTWRKIKKKKKTKQKTNIKNPILPS